MPAGKKNQLNSRTASRDMQIYVRMSNKIVDNIGQLFIVYIMNFSMKTEYALRALYEIGQSQSYSQEKEGNNQPISRKQISVNQSIPIHFLERILISLKRANLIKSLKGPGGGYVLLKDKESISLWDIYQAVDMKHVKGIKCFPGLNHECIHIGKCKLKGFWFDFNEVIYNSLSSFSLERLYKKV